MLDWCYDKGDEFFNVYEINIIGFGIFFYSEIGNLIKLFCNL